MANVLTPQDLEGAVPIPAPDQTPSKVLSAADLEGAVPLNGQASATGYAKSIASGVGEGVSNTLGLPIDLYNALGDLVQNKGAGWLLNKLGMPDAAKAIHYNPIYAQSGQSFRDVQQNAGLDYQPVTPGEQGAKGLTSSLTTGGLAGALTGGVGGAVAGAGGALGGDLAHAANAATGGWIPNPIADLLGVIFGSGGVSGIANRTALYDPPAIMKDFKRADTDPGFASDVTDKGLGITPGLYGAQGTSIAKAQKIQAGIGGFADRSLSNVPTQQAQGQIIKDAADQAVAKMQGAIKQSYDDVDAAIPGTTTVSTDNTLAAIKLIQSHAGDSEAVKSFAANPLFTRLVSLLNEPNLSWDQMNLIRKELGGSLNSAGLSDSERGLGKQVYAGMKQDMSQAITSGDPAIGNPTAALAKLNDANNLFMANTDHIDNLTKTVIGKPSPEMLPKYFAAEGKYGSTRVDNLFNALGNPPGMQADFGKAMLHNAAQDAGVTNLDKLMTAWKGYSPEYQSAVTQAPHVADDMSVLQRLYAATEKSRGLAQSTPSGTSGNPLLAATVQSVTPPFTYAAAKALQSGLGPRMATPVTGGMITSGQMATGAGTGLTALPGAFPDVHVPSVVPPALPGPSPGADVSGWLATADRPAATAYITQRLGQTVASQVPGDPQGYKAALSQLMSDPLYRKELLRAAPAS